VLWVYEATKPFDPRGAEAYPIPSHRRGLFFYFVLRTATHNFELLNIAQFSERPRTRQFILIGYLHKMETPHNGDPRTALVD
jgi:hypothetical protein